MNDAIRDTIVIVCKINCTISHNNFTIPMHNKQENLCILGKPFVLHTLYTASIMVLLSHVYLTKIELNHHTV